MKHVNISDNQKAVLEEAVGEKHVCSKSSKSVFDILDLVDKGYLRESPRTGMSEIGYYYATDKARNMFSNQALPTLE